MATADAHEAPKGWTYPFVCCSDRDCREVPDKAITFDTARGGYSIVATGEFLSEADPRIKRISPDGAVHWCSIDGKADTKTICLILPPPAF